jgi:hypothetical protein
VTTAPVPPAGAVADFTRHLDRDRGEVARWRHADTLPALELSLRAAGQFGGFPERPATVRVSTFPGPVQGVTDPGELRQMAWMLLDAARWLERQHGRPTAEDDPQQTIYDHIEETG